MTISVKDPVNDAVQKICANVLTPFYYAGMIDKTVDKRAMWFNDMFFPESMDIVHDKRKMTWHEMSERFPSLMPTDVCHCEEGDFISMTEYYMERTVSHGHWWLGFNIDCDFAEFLQPGENPYASGAFQIQVEDYFNKMRIKLQNAFRTKHELWAVQMLTEGEITVKPKGGLPYKIQFQRDGDMNHTINDQAEMWCNVGKDSKKCPDVIRHIEMMDDMLFKKNRGRGDIMFMNTTTCNWLRACLTQQIKDCKELALAQFLMPSTIRNAGLEVPRPVDGARFFGRFSADREIDIYCVDTNFQFCDPDQDGKEVCINPIKDGDVYLVNRNATQNNTLGSRTAYGRVHNFHNSQRLTKDFTHQITNPRGTCMELFTQSSPTKLLECPNASVKWNVCGGKAPEKKTA